MTRLANKLTHVAIGCSEGWTQASIACYFNAASAPDQSSVVALWIWIRTQRASPLSPVDRLHSAAHKKRVPK